MPTSIPDLFFAPFRLDTESGRLWNGATEIAIRPKTLAVLRHLAEHAGELVTVGDLVHAVWADSHGSAPLVKGCVREVRKLLGDDSATRRYIETVGRRGYRFVAPIVASPSAAVTAWASDDAEPTFVGRRDELTALDAALAAARAGTRQVLFVTGEPGIGKTALTMRFLTAAAATHELRIGRGQCVEHYGPGEPYLPVLQALATMCRGSGADRVLDVLGRYAPTWLAQMPALLSKDDRHRLRGRATGTNRDSMLREMCDAVEALGAERPLVLWLDDLHWSDPSTVDLVSALARRAEPARFLLLATYRPAEVVVSEHPLGPARQSLLGGGHARELALAALSDAEVQRYVAERFPVHAIPAAFGAAAVEITDGNPLFLATVIDELVAERVLAENDGTWQLRKRVESLAEILPESLRHLIQRQVERLSEEDQRILEAGSAVGREFAAGAVATALALDADAVDERLQALTRSAHLVDPRGLDAPPSRATSGRYAFAHALHRRVLYGRLSPARRARLHRRLGEAQQAAWGDRSDEIAAELALHFERGGDAPRAIRFLRVAGENAARRLAATEAIAHLTRALGLVEHLARRDRPLAELRLQMALGLMLMNSRDHAAPEIDRTYGRAADLAARIANRPELYPMLWGLHRVTLLRGDIARALALARKGVAMARKSGKQEELLEASLGLGVSLFYAGDLAAARVALTKALQLRRVVHPSSPAARIVDPAVVVHAHLAFVAWFRGEDAKAREHLEETHRQAGAFGQPIALAYSHIAAGMLHQFARDPRAVRAAADAVLALSPEHGFSMFVAWAHWARGWALAVDGGQRLGPDEIRAGIEQWRTTGSRFLVPYTLGLLADAQAAVGEHAAALATVEDALAVLKRTGERWWEPELLRLAGELRSERARRARGARRERERRAARSAMRKAIALARRRGARALVERTRASLAHVD